MNIKQLTNECSEYINGHPPPLFRGSNARGLSLKPFTKISIRQDRKPRDSRIWQTNLFNIAFEITHDIQKLRNRTMFVHSEPNHAGTFGNLHLVLPTNNSKIITTTMVDSLDDMEYFDSRVCQYIADVINNQRKANSNDNYVSVDQTDIAEFFDRCSTIEECKEESLDIYKAMIQTLNHPLVEALTANPNDMSIDSPSDIKIYPKSHEGVELMILAQDAYLINPQHHMWEEWLTQATVDNKSFSSEFSPTNFKYSPEYRMVAIFRYLKTI